MELFKEEYYKRLEGGILEAFGKLFTRDLVIYVYPSRDGATGTILTIDNIPIPAMIRNLFRHLVERGQIKQLDNFDENVLHILSREVVRRIKDGDATWESMVPQEVAQMVRQRKLFGYHEPQVLSAHN